ncbi:MAG: DUF935 family protein [Chthoniobacteraceae bacterium]
MPLLQRLQAYFRSQLPTRRVTLYNERNTYWFQLQEMDVDRVRVILDAADAGNPRDLFSLYRDLMAAGSHVQAEFSKRKIAVLGDVLSIQPWDRSKADDRAACEAIQAMIESCPGWLDACIHLLDGTLWPVAVLEKVYRRVRGPACATSWRIWCRSPTCCSITRRGTCGFARPIPGRARPRRR